MPDTNSIQDTGANAILKNLAPKDQKKSASKKSGKNNILILSPLPVFERSFVIPQYIGIWPYLCQYHEKDGQMTRTYVYLILKHIQHCIDQSPSLSTITSEVGVHIPNKAGKFALVKAPNKLVLL